jgi:rod shape-determining protein MreC
VAVIIAAIVGVALLLNDRRETAQSQVYGATRTAVDTLSTPVGKVVSAPSRWAGAGFGAIQDYVFAGSQNRELRQQLADMQRLRDEATQLRNTNARLRAVLGLTIDPPLPMVTAQVITDARGPFANSRLADAGSEHGVAIGNPVMSDHGLVGRVVGVTRGASRVLLLTDMSSRTPVMVERTNARAILTGDGGAHPAMAYMRGVDPVKVGDRVLTSGDGGVFPRGLPVGVVVRGMDGGWRVKLDCDDAPIDFVRILLFRSFDQVVDQKALAGSTVPPMPPGETGAFAGQGATAPPGAAAESPRSTAAKARASAAPKPASTKPEATP